MGQGGARRNTTCLSDHLSVCMLRKLVCSRICSCKRCLSLDEEVEE